MFINLALVGEVISKVEDVSDKVSIFYVRVALVRKNADPEVQRWKIITFHDNRKLAQSKVVSGCTVHVTGRPGVNVYKSAEGLKATQELRASSLIVLPTPVKEVQKK